MSETPMEVEDEAETTEEAPSADETAEVLPETGAIDATQPEDTAARDTDDKDSDDTLSIDSSESDVDFSPDKDTTEVIIRASTLKEEGNEHFKSGELEKAMRAYRKGTNVLKPLNKNNTGDDQVKALYISLQTNLSMVCYKQNKTKLSLDVASQALKVDPSNVKALYRRAMAHRKLGNAAEARIDLKEALKYDPNNVAVRKELVSLKKELDEATAREKKQLQKAFSSKSGGRFLYDDKEEEMRKREEAEKKKKEQEEEAKKKRKEEWEDECVKRMAKGDDAISFDDWEKDRKEQQKQKKEEDKRRLGKLQKARASSKASQSVVHDDSDEELTESELSMLRGYKKTSDGRTTSYFTREMSEAEKQILGNTAPQKLNAAPVAPSPAVISPASSSAGKGKASAWNQAGTWEEKNATDWCTPHLQSKLLSTTTRLSATDDYIGVITTVNDLTGEASVALTGGKKRYIFDYHLTLQYEIRDNSDDTAIASGSLKLPDICSTSHEELEVDVMAWSKAPISDLESDATECRTLLIAEVRAAVQQFVKDFNDHY